MTRYHIFAETGDVRPPKKGEWILSFRGRPICVEDDYEENQSRTILTKLPDAQVLTPEMVGAVSDLHDALTRKYHTVTVKSGEDCGCDICQRMVALRAAFPSIFAPDPQKERTVREKIDNVEGGRTVRQQITTNDGDLDLNRLIGVLSRVVERDEILADAIDAIRKDMALAKTSKDMAAKGEGR